MTDLLEHGSWRGELAALLAARGHAPAAAGAASAGAAPAWPGRRAPRRPATRFILAVGAQPQPSDTSPSTRFPSPSWATAPRRPGARFRLPAFKRTFATRAKHLATRTCNTFCQSFTSELQAVFFRLNTTGNHKQIDNYCCALSGSQRHSACQHVHRQPRQHGRKACCLPSSIRSREL